jgi:hypothetical protein
VLVSAPGSGIASIAAAGGAVYWTSLDATGAGTGTAPTGKVWKIDRCGGKPVQLAAGRDSPTMLVASGTTLAWTENWVSGGGGSWTAAVERMTTDGSGLTTLASYAYTPSSGAWTGWTVSSVAADGDRVYWSGVSSACVGEHTCDNSIYLAESLGTQPGVLYEYAYPYPSSVANIIAGAGSIALQDGASLLRVPENGGPVTTLDTRDGTQFLGNALAPCGQDTCWFGMAADGSTLGYVRIPPAGASQLVTLPPLMGNGMQRVYVGSDGLRIYFTQGNFDTYVKPVLDFLSVDMAGQDQRTVASNTTPVSFAFDDAYVYFAADDTIHVTSRR